jgi:hypothetical protein
MNELTAALEMLFMLVVPLALAVAIIGLILYGLARQVRRKKKML